MSLVGRVKPAGPPCMVIPDSLVGSRQPHAAEASCRSATSPAAGGAGISDVPSTVKVERRRQAHTSHRSPRIRPVSFAPGNRAEVRHYTPPPGARPRPGPAIRSRSPRGRGARRGPRRGATARIRPATGSPARWTAPRARIPIKTGPGPGGRPPPVGRQAVRCNSAPPWPSVLPAGARPTPPPPRPASRNLRANPMLRAVPAR